MRAQAFWKAVTMDRSDLLEQFVELLRELDIRFCVVGGQAYVEPLVSLDLDLVVAPIRLSALKPACARDFTSRAFPTV